MPIISTIGRRSLSTRSLIAGIYVVLLAGALTMVYPFLLMIAGSTKSGADMKEQQIVPGFLTSETALYRKHIEGLFNEKLVALKVAYGLEISSFVTIEPPRQVNHSLVDQWRQFLDQDDLPHWTFDIGYIHVVISSQTRPHALRAFARKLTDEFSSDLAEANRELGTSYTLWREVIYEPDDYLLRRNKPAITPFHQRRTRFKLSQPISNRYYFSASGFYRALFLKTQYTRQIETYNAEHGTNYASYDDVRLTRRVPSGTVQEVADWAHFVRSTLNLLWLRVDDRAEPNYRSFLQAKYASIDRLNERYGTHYGSFNEIPLADQPPREGTVLSDWEAFISGWQDPDTKKLHTAPLNMIQIDSIDFRFQDFLDLQFDTINELNEQLGTSFSSFDQIDLPQRQLHYQTFQDMIGALRWEFVKRNYLSVFEFIMLHGRAMFNTAVYCTLAVLGALLVNPMAAYAMSRYRMPSAYKILLFLMMTMAFPQMVTSIPAFLLLRDFHMLNTFWALVLPGLASGYSIFLLKGFFDSLPRELYECAQLDGAGEWTMFWQITMSLSKPILAVIALGAFTGAYSNFLFALLICQDPDMWTLMVWLFQLQESSGMGVIFASLIVASVPTFLIFALCQNIIMRGIVVPVEK